MAVIIDGEKRHIARRFMTRSMRESYHVLKKVDPGISMALPKLYLLCPSWFCLLHTKKFVFVCIVPTPRFVFLL